jgi:CheY-like chemotaxis protein
LPIVFFAGYAADASLDEIFPQGGPTLIPKPFTEEQLARTAREALDRPRSV